MNPYFNNLLIDCKLRPFSWVSQKAFINIQQLRAKNFLLIIYEVFSVVLNIFPDGRVDNQNSL